MSAEEFVSKLALGTAQFGLDYGINNTAGRPTDEVVQSILAVAAEAGISLLDTAAAYGDSETRLGTLLADSPSQFSLVTKLTAAAPAEVAKQLAASLARLQRQSVYGLLFHDFGALQRQPDAWDALIAARNAGQTQRIGVSLYHPWQAEWLLESGSAFDLVQFPYNVLDQRFGPLLPRLAERGVEVHVRSAFLQGLLLRPLEALPSFFEPLRPKLAHLRHLVTEAAIPLESALLLFAATAPNVARVVIGVESAENLRVNLAADQHLKAAQQLRPALQALAETTETFILPYTWPQLR
jgi:aryl-alcohol dehydrogenase-like predicted oxidoreductase